eukprot:659375-Rhodomonas_salina.1
MSATATPHADSCLCACYAMSGTAIGRGVMWVRGWQGVGASKRGYGGAGGEQAAAAASAHVAGASSPPLSSARLPSAAVRRLRCVLYAAGTRSAAARLPWRATLTSPILLHLSSLASAPHIAYQVPPLRLGKVFAQQQQV